MSVDVVARGLAVSATRPRPTGGQVLYSADPAAIQANTGPFNITVGSNPTINAPHSSWNDVTFAWGWNTQVNGNPVEAGKPVLAYQFETGFWDVGKGKLGSESHHTFNDISDGSHRVYSYWLPWDGGSGSVVTHKIDLILFEKFAVGGAEQIRFDFQGANPFINIQNSGYIKFATNGGAVAYQRNAANNADLKLPYLNSSDRLVVEQPATIGGTMSGASTALLGLNAAGMVTDQYIINASWNSGVATVNALSLIGAASASLNASFWNNGVGNTRFDIWTSSGGGDPMLNLRVVSGTAWTVGVDNSDSDKFKIGIGDGDVAADTKFTIDGNGLATFASTVKTLSTTVAGLPSAATAGSGARAFITDATATAFLSTVAGGGANKVPVVSDGSVWLIG